MAVIVAPGPAAWVSARFRFLSFCFSGGVSLDLQRVAM